MSTNAVSFLKNKGGYNEDLHHAYLMVGNKAAARAAANELLRDELKIEMKGNPDVHELDFAAFSIDDARELKASHFLKPIEGQAYFIISFDSITWEAQQSLLKVFEEPVTGTHFFVIAPSLQGFLPTLLSRFVVIHMEPAALKTTDVEKFLASTPAERLKLIGDIVEDKDKQAAIVFLNELQTLASKFLKKGRVAEARALGETLDLVKFLHTRSPSVKMILEHIALTFPTISTP